MKNLKTWDNLTLVRLLALLWENLAHVPYNKLLQITCKDDLRKYLKINTSYSRYSRNISMYVPVSACMKIVLFVRSGGIFVLLF